MNEHLDLAELTANTRQALEGLLAVAKLMPGKILLVGCSTSEVAGETIGTASNTDIAQAILAGIRPLIEQHGLHLAVQCCEHLNRALVVEEACAERYGLEPVTVVPYAKAGGAFAALAYRSCVHPVMVETIQADAGLDIGDTFIGMHLKPVVVPVRLSIKNIGQAHLTLARTRPKLIGGERARYSCD